MEHWWHGTDRESIVRVEQPAAAHSNLQLNSTDCTQCYALNGRNVLHCINLLRPKTYFMYHQFNIQKFCVLPTMHLCVLCGSENKQRLFPYTALTDWFV